MVSKDELRDGFLKCGIKKGDVVMLHSSYTALRGADGGPDAVLDVLIELIGEDGTLLIPAFNFNSWSDSHYFDIVETASEMGVITEYARARPSFKRTIHPIYSFVVYGKLQRQFLACDDEEAFGSNSVFALFHKLDGLIISIGLEYNDSFTFIHYAELACDVKYRRIKQFSGIYVGYDRKPALATYSMLVRATLKIKTMVTPGLNVLEEQGVIKNIKIGPAKIDFSRASEFYTAALPLIKEHPAYFHK